MTNILRVAALQYCASGNAPETLSTILPMIETATQDGATLICLPEAASFIAKNRDTLGEHAEWDDASPTLDALCGAAAGAKIWLLVGSLLTRRRHDARLVNRCYLIGPDGHIAAQYDKIHMFDAVVGDGHTYKESANFAAGDSAIMTAIEDIPVGLTICYDLRFAALYRTLAKAGAAIITVPAAFTYNSGRAHWHVLLRARAIETGCYIIAPAQCGTHADGRRTYGHAMIIAPWGDILTEAETDDANPKAGANDTIIMADLDLELVGKARQSIPALTHDRDFTLL